MKWTMCRKKQRIAMPRRTTYCKKQGVGPLGGSRRMRLQCHRARAKTWENQRKTIGIQLYDSNEVDDVPPLKTKDRDAEVHDVL